MSVLSILLQLQSFLSTETLQYMEGMGNMTRARDMMSRFECSGCSHIGMQQAWPPRRVFETSKPTARRLVCRPCGAVELSSDASSAAPEAAAMAFDSAAAPMPLQFSSMAVAPQPADYTAVAGVASSHVAVLQQPSLAPEAEQPQPSMRGNPFAPLMRQSSTEGNSGALGAVKPVASKAHAAPKAKPVDATADPKPSAAAAVAKAGSDLTKAQKKNAQRSRRRQGKPQLAPTVGGMAKENCTPPNPPVSETTDAAESVASCAPSDADLPFAMADVAAEAAAQSAGLFGLLAYDAVIILMERLHADVDVRALACTCKHMASVAQDGLLWRVLFAKHYPASQLSAASLGDWKHTFMLELSSNADALMCYHSKVELGAYDEKRRKPEVLGFPLTFTVNPRTREIDHIYSPLDTLAFSAFADDGVRRSVWGEKFTHFLPLYLTPAHYEAGKPTLRNLMVQLLAPSPTWAHARGRWDPEMALDVIPKLLCTLIVLLVDKGVAASDVFINGFIQIYRLLHALADDHPQLRVIVTKRVRAFISDEARRTKSAEPSLGVLVPLLALTQGLRWCDLAWPLLEEMMDRGVLFACKDQPALATPAKLETDEALRMAWEARKVANRLIMFSVGFLTRLAKTSTKDLDAFHGQPTPWLRASMRQHIRGVMAADSWPDFFKLVNAPLPSKRHMHEWLSRAVANSERKGYHKRGMDFSRVQRSGVSAILRKGESVSASPTMKAVRLEEVWRWAGHGSKFLDASALAYTFEGEPAGLVDYANQRSVTGLIASRGYTAYVDGARRVAMLHSGDQIQGNEGTHTIQLDLRALSDKVGAIWLTLSAWRMNLATYGIIRPEVRCFDPADKSNEPLARYELEGKATGEETAVVMCKIWRPAPGKSWQVTAIGELCQGRAGNYEPIHAKIASLYGKTHDAAAGRSGDDGSMDDA